jgi:hypothetical protein
MRSTIINSLFILIALVFSLAAMSQEEEPECEIAFISEHYVLNSTGATISLSVDNKNQASFPNDGPTLFEIAAGEEIKVSHLEWAGEFRGPTSWYVIKNVNQPSDSSFNTPDRWVFKKLEDTEGRYLYTFTEEE